MAEDKNASLGNTSMLLLQLPSERNMYGYEMVETLQKRSEFVLDLRAGTMHPLLYTMEAKRLLVLYEKETQGKVRRYCSIAKESRGVLARKKKDWNTYFKAMKHVIGGALYGNARISGSFDRADQE